MLSVLLPLILAYGLSDLYSEIWAHPVIELRQLTHVNTIAMVAAAVAGLAAPPLSLWLLARRGGFGYRQHQIRQCRILPEVGVEEDRIVGVVGDAREGDDGPPDVGRSAAERPQGFPSTSQEAKV